VSNIQYSLYNLKNVPVPLYHRYLGREKPQPAYVEMDNFGTVTANWVKDNPPILSLGSFRWEVSPYADGESLAMLLESSRMQSLFHQVHEGARIAFSDNRFFVTLDPISITAESEIRSMLECESPLYSRCEFLNAKAWVESRFSAEDVADSEDMDSYIRLLKEEMRDVMEERKNILFFGDTEEAVTNLCLNYLSHVVDVGKKDDLYAQTIAEKMANYDYCKYGDLPDRFQRVIEDVLREEFADSLVNFGNSDTIPFNRDGHFDDSMKPEKTQAAVFHESD